MIRLSFELARKSDTVLVVHLKMAILLTFIWRNRGIYPEDVIETEKNILPRKKIAAPAEVRTRDPSNKNQTVASEPSCSDVHVCGPRETLSIPYTYP
jgi:hypothetical protein